MSNNARESSLHCSPIPIIDDIQLPEHYKGLYVETENKKVILINSAVKDAAEKRCVIAEELGHYYTSAGNILDQRDIGNRKQEVRARSWAYEYLVPLAKIVQAYRDGVSGRHELAEYLNVTEEFLQETIDRYRQKYGLYATYEQYTIYFDPLGVIAPLE